SLHGDQRDTLDHIVTAHGAGLGVGRDDKRVGAVILERNELATAGEHAAHAEAMRDRRDDDLGLLRRDRERHVEKPLREMGEPASVHRNNSPRIQASADAATPRPRIKSMASFRCQPDVATSSTSKVRPAGSPYHCSGGSLWNSLGCDTPSTKRSANNLR